MKKKMTGFIVGTLMFTLIAGTAAFASESSNGTPSRAAEETKQTITIEDAAKIALEDAQVSETDVVIYKQIREYDDNMDVYEIDFFIPGQTKYEYEIAADTGKILENDKEAWEADDDREYAGLTAGKTEDPENVDKGLEEAVDKAIMDAGVKKEDVTICKKETDYDDGVEKYEVEFRTADGYEYEYEIDVKTGKILDKDVELDD